MDVLLEFTLSRFMLPFDIHCVCSTFCKTTKVVVALALYHPQFITMHVFAKHAVSNAFATCMLLFCPPLNDFLN